MVAYLGAAVAVHGCMIGKRSLRPNRKSRSMTVCRFQKRTQPYTCTGYELTCAGIRLRM